MAVKYYLIHPRSIILERFIEYSLHGLILEIALVNEKNAVFLVLLLIRLEYVPVSQNSYHI
jgi:hypothetical protein